MTAEEILWQAVWQTVVLVITGSALALTIIGIDTLTDRAKRRKK